MESETNVKQIVRRTPDIISIRFDRPDGFDFIPGQYMFITLNIGEEDAVKHFTISSSPTEPEYLEITKKLTGHDFANALAALKVGDRVQINGPFGDFAFKGEYEKIALLSGGIGITPLRSMVRYSTDRKLRTMITLLYSNRSEDDIAFREEFEEMQKQNRNLKVVHTITRPGEKWKGLTGRISREMIQKEIQDYMERIFYISGPQKMVDDMVATLVEMKIPEDQIKQEYFPGY